MLCSVETQLPTLVIQAQVKFRYLQRILGCNTNAPTEAAYTRLLKAILPPISNFLGTDVSREIDVDPANESLIVIITFYLCVHTFNGNVPSDLNEQRQRDHEELRKKYPQLIDAIEKAIQHLEEQQKRCSEDTAENLLW